MNDEPAAVVRIAHGLAAAEVGVWSGMFQRALALPYWTRRKRREIEDLHDRDGLLTLPVPFALNQDPSLLRAAPGPRTEWFAFQVAELAASGGRYDRGVALRAWLALAHDPEPPRLTLGQRATLDHLSAGVHPPQSGHDHPHHFDDAALPRAVAMAAVADLAADPDDLLRAVVADATIGNAADGVWCAQAAAAAVLALRAGADATAGLAAARACLPDGSWSDLQLRRALACADAADGPLDLAWRLDHEVANAAYSYGDAAPDVLAIALAILLFAYPRVDTALLAASAVPRHAPGVAPLVGALFAAGGALSAPLERLIDRLPPLAGVALPRWRGVRLIDALAADRPPERD